MSDLVFVEEQPVAGRVVDLRLGHAIGRDGCDLVTPDPEVSRRHAVLVAAACPDGLAIADAGSLNGTFVNGQRVAGEVALRPGDVVQMGNTVWRVASRGDRELREAAPTRAATRPPSP